MVDIVDRETRSRMMSGIRSQNTIPELQVRSYLHTTGLRFRLHVKQLPGKPDLVFRKHGVALFVHGCFWHGHDCKLFKLPATRTAFWRDKIAANVKRDRKVRRDLLEAGWRVGVVWECAVRGKTQGEIRTRLKGLAAWIIASSRKREMEVSSG